MELFATCREKLAYLLETDAALDPGFEALEARTGELVTEELPLDNGIAKKAETYLNRLKQHTKIKK